MTRMMNQNQQQFAHESNSRLFIGNSEIKIIPSEFLISVDYQRKLEMERVMHIVDNFDINKVNIPKVSLRGNKYFVIDGAHTLAAMKIVNDDRPFDAMCRVFNGLTYQEEAELFASQYENSRKVPFRYELNAEFCAEDPNFVAFRKITEKVGLILDMEGKVGRYTIGALAKAWSIYQKNGPELYEKVLRLIVKTWNGESWSLQSSILGGVATFVKKYPNFSEKRFIKYLSVADANMLMRGSVGITRSRDIAYAVAIAKLYNTRGGKNAVNIDLLLV